MSVSIPHREGKVWFASGQSTGLGILLFILVLLGAALPAMAQLAGKGAITGTITDKTGAVIPGAAITAKNTATGIATVSKSTGAGDYNFSTLDPGVYTLTISAAGFEKLTQENIHVNALETLTYNPVLQVGSADVQITVTAAPPQLETSNATLGATMEQETYSALPIEMGAYGQADQRRATDFVFLMPGVQGNNTNGNATTNTGVVNGSGSRGAVSNVYIDGIAFVRAGGNGDPRYVWSAISVDAIDQFQVQTNGYSAMFEGQGVLNYSIKHGGNQYHGSMYEFFRNTSLDTWGFFRSQIQTDIANPNASDNVYQSIKPPEHMNEYGIAFGGPLIPYTKLKDKLFFFTNYNGYRYAASNPTAIRFPTNRERTGDFSQDGINIYDPFSTGAKSTRCQLTSTSTKGGASCGSGTANVIPSSYIPTWVTNMTALLPSISSDATGNNYMAANNTALNNWSTTSRIDYIINSSDTLSVFGAVGRQASSNPVGQNTAGRNVGPVPFNYGQTYAPKTAVWAVEETHTFSSNLINQVKWGYARYNGPTFSPNENTAYAATAMGLSNLPAGQAQNVFPIVVFGSETSAPTQWGGTTENRTVAENYTVLDNVQWNVGKHSFTFGGQVAWLLYNVYNAYNKNGYSTPITLTNATTETAQLSGTTAVSGTGLSLASFLIGEVDKGSYTDYSYHPEYGARFRAISPYVQDDWKFNQKLTLNLGLRYDFYPSAREVNNAESFFDPNVTNAVTGLLGGLNFTGNGANTCNCKSPAKNYYKNWGPRIGLAYQLDPKTVIRSSWGVMFSHGDAVGGLNTSIGTLGYSSALSASSASNLSTMTNLQAGGSGALPSISAAAGAASGSAYGTGYYESSSYTSGYTGSPTSATYDDPYLGGRAPEFINWNLSIQRQLTNNLALTVSYVGAEGHFLQLDGYHARGAAANDLDPKYLPLGTTGIPSSSVTVLQDTKTSLVTDCVTNAATLGITCPGFNSSYYVSSNKLYYYLKPYPYQAFSDNYGYVGNSNYHSLQVVLNMRSWHGLTFNTSYVQSRTIDDGGTFRTGYAIPAGTLANHPTASYSADKIERGVSTTNQPEHFVLTAVWAWPLGKTILAQNPLERNILGGFQWSGVFQAFSGSPLAITEGTCQTNPAQVTISSSTGCAAIMNPGFTGSARQNGKWGKGSLGTTYYNGAVVSTATAISQPTYIVPSTGTSTSTATGPFMAPVSGILSSYYNLISDAPRTAPYNLYSPSYYQADMAVIRSFPLKFIGEAGKFDFRAEWYNVTNHTQFALASTVLGKSTFGQVTNASNLARKSAQFSARISF
jgi:hypothetical protein